MHMQTPNHHNVGDTVLSFRLRGCEIYMAALLLPHACSTADNKQEANDVIFVHVDKEGGYNIYNASSPEHWYTFIYHHSSLS